MKLRVHPNGYVVARLPQGTLKPAAHEDFFSVTVTRDEVSIVCQEGLEPLIAEVNGGWRWVQVAEKLDFAAVGVLSRLLSPLAEAGVSVFVVSTYDTDHLFVKEASLAAAVASLRAAGFEVDA